MADLYNVILNAAVQEGENLIDVKTRLAALFRVDSARIEHLLRNLSPIIKSGLCKEEALKYKQAIERIGVSCRIELVKRPLSLTGSAPQKAPAKKKALIYHSKIIRQEVGVLKYIVWPFVRLKNAAESLFDLLAGMMWEELMGKSPNYSQMAQFAAFFLFSALAYALWYIPEYSYKVFLVVGLATWVLDRVLLRHHLLQSIAEIQISLQQQQDGQLVWRRKNPSGEHDTLRFARHEVSKVTLAREHVEGGAFHQVIGTVWRIYLTLQDGELFLLDEHIDVLQAIKRAKHVARELSIPVIIDQSLGQNSLSAEPLQISQSMMAFKRKRGAPGSIVVKKNARGASIVSAWDLRNVWWLIRGMIHRFGFLLFLLIFEGFMVKYGLLLNWLLNPYFGLSSPGFPFELSFTGVFSLFAPEGDWKEWLKLGMVMALLLYQGVKMGRRKSVVIGPQDTTVFLGKEQLASLKTSTLEFPLLVTSPTPLLLFMDHQQVVQLDHFQTEQEIRAFTVAIEQNIRECRQT